MTTVVPIVAMRRDHAQIIFDRLVGSLDFGSGFLYDEDVEALRALAVLLGVDPMTATPSGYQSQYAHHFSADVEHGPKHDSATCRDCR